MTLINIESIFEKTDEFKSMMKMMPDYTFFFEQQADSSTYELNI